MLHNKMKGIKLILSGKAEIGNAGEQPVRNNPIDWNQLEVDIYSASNIKADSGQECLRKLSGNLELSSHYFKTFLSISR